MSYRDLGTARERIERLEAALRDGPAPKRPLRWLKAIALTLLVVAGTAVILVAWRLVR